MSQIACPRKSASDFSCNMPSLKNTVEKENRLQKLCQKLHVQNQKVKVLTNDCWFTNIGLIYKLAALLKKMHPAKYILWYETPQPAP